MRNFSKALLTSVAFILCAVLVSYLLIEPFFEVQPNYYQDQRARETLSGTIDFGVFGASFAYRSVDPNVVDSILGTRGYNFSGAGMPMEGRYELFLKELGRNPIKTVVIDLGSDMLYRERDADLGIEGSLYLIDRLDNWRERLGFIARCVSPDQYFFTYSHLLTEGVTTLKNGKISQYSDEYRLDSRGWYPKYPNDMSMTKAEYEAIHNTKSIYTEVNDANLEYLAKIVKVCKEKGIEVVLFTAPVSLKYICEYSDLDRSREVYVKAAQELGVPYYDFNLLRERNTLFSEETDFFDEAHMSIDGAPKFSAYFAEFILKLRSGEDVDELFFASYDDVDAELMYNVQCTMYN